MALIVLASVTSLFTACSYITDFVVVNTSSQPVEVRYRIKVFPGPFDPSPPKATTASALFAEDQQWRELSAARYEVDSENRTVTVRLMPAEALLVDRVHGAGMRVDDAKEAEDFSVTEIVISGAHGETRLEGERLRKAFVPESKKVYTLTYK